MTSAMKMTQQQSTAGDELGGRVRENRMSWGYMERLRWVCKEGEDNIGHDDNGRDNELEDGVATTLAAMTTT